MELAIVPLKQITSRVQYKEFEVSKKLMLLVLSFMFSAILPQFQSFAKDAPIPCPELKITGVKLNAVSCLYYDSNNLVSLFQNGDESSAAIFNKDGESWNLAYYVGDPKPVVVEFIKNDEVEGIVLSIQQDNGYSYLFIKDENGRNGWLLLKQAESKKFKLEKKVCPTFSYHDQNIVQVGCFFVQFGYSLNFAKTDNFYEMYLTNSEGYVEYNWSRELYPVFVSSGKVFFYYNSNENILIPLTDNYQLAMSPFES